MTIGNVAIVLNAHFPYVRRAGRWPHGEEALHEVIAESYVPLLRMLLDLRHGTGALPLTVSLSPVLLEQLGDPLVLGQVAEWIAAWRERAEADRAHFEWHNDGHAAYLASFYIDWIGSIAQSFEERFGRNILAALRNALSDAVELLLAPATYAYLPHLSKRGVHAQLKAGALPLMRHLGRRPTGLWLPGGGLGAVEPRFATELGLRYAVGASQQQSTFVAHSSLPTVHPDHMVVDHVTAPAVGYPGDGLYREFYRRHPDSGIAYWRVTTADTPPEHKAWYDPYLAFNRADEHAAHFVHALHQRLYALTEGGMPPALVLAFDAELFGHWWFEGIHWLQRVLEQLQASKKIKLVSVSQLDLPPANDAIEDVLHPLFDDPALEPLRQQLRNAAARFDVIVQRYPAAEGLQEALLTQAARELLLAQSSDWTALVATDAATDYAYRRVHEHLDRFERLITFAEDEQGAPQAARYLDEIAALDNLFPFLNYRVFA
jgi:1,4-alpha-glucan branching enzyme